MAETGKIKRKFMAHFIEVPGNPLVTVKLGSGIEEMNIELAPNVVKKQDITGVNDSYVDTYDVTQAVEPYFAVVGDPLFDWLQAIAEERRTLDDLNTHAIDVKLWEDPTNGKYPAMREKCVVAVKSYGGNTEGYQIPFDINRTGEIEHGTFDINTKTFTAVLGD
jgi:hypothetical protein